MFAVNPYVRAQARSVMPFTSIKPGNMKYNTIVIGGGLAGLVAGGTLAKFGKKVLLIEQHHKPGGCATAFKRGDFVVEVGLHEMSGHGPGDTLLDVLRMLGVYKELKFLQVPELYAMYSGDEKLIFPHGYEEATRSINRKISRGRKGH